MDNGRGAIPFVKASNKNCLMELRVCVCMRVCVRVCVYASGVRASGVRVCACVCVRACVCKKEPKNPPGPQKN